MLSLLRTQQATLPRPSLQLCITLPPTKATTRPPSSTGSITAASTRPDPHMITCQRLVEDCLSWMGWPDEALCYHKHEIRVQVTAKPRQARPSHGTSKAALQPQPQPSSHPPTTCPLKQDGANILACYAAVGAVHELTSTLGASDPQTIGSRLLDECTSGRILPGLTATAAHLELGSVSLASASL